MPRYLVERTFPDGQGPLAAATGPRNPSAVIGANAQHGVTWVHSYVTSDGRRSYCIVDGPSGRDGGEPGSEFGLTPCRHFIVAAEVAQPQALRALGWAMSRETGV